MRTARLYAGAGIVLGVGAEIPLDASRSHYLKNVLRLKPGARLILFDGETPVDYLATLSWAKKQAVARIDSATSVDTESAVFTHLVQGLARGDHCDWAIQKSTELGVNRITLFNAQRTQSPPKAELLDKKREHWLGVAASAAEQCGRALLPRIEYVADLAGALGEVDEVDKWLLSIDGLPPGRPAANSCAILLGPEGGLSPDEIDRARLAGFLPISLGPRILRTETAATAALAWVQLAAAPGFPVGNGATAV